jgi:hypothetical protein
MMFRRPSQRVKCPPAQNVGKPKPGTFLYNLMTPGEVECFTFKKGPIYKKEDYMRLLEKNHEKLGIPYVKPDLPEPVPYVPPEKPNEPRLEFGDQVYVTLRILKSGIVRVKVSCAIAMMYEKYYRHGVQPPFKTVLQAYKSHGFSPQFLEKIKKSHERKTAYAKKVPGILEKIFEKEAIKKAKKEREKEKEKEREDEEGVPPLDDVEEDDTPPIEECELDVEPDEEEDVEEEEYVSDNET